MLFLDAGKGEMGGPASELLGSPFFGPIFLMASHGLHLL